MIKYISLGDWSWVNLKSVSSNISSGEVSFSLGHGVVGVNVVCHLSWLWGWGGIVVRWLVNDPVVVFSPGSNAIFVGINGGEPVLGGSELLNLESIAVIGKSSLIFQDIE